MTIRDLFVPFEDELQLLPPKRVTEPPLIEWKAAFGDLFFRVKGADPEVLWCDLAYTVPPSRPLRASKSEQITKRLSKCLEKGLLYRVVPFQDGDDWALIRMGRFLVKSPSQKLPARWFGPTPPLAPTKALAFISRPLSDYSQWTEQGDDELRVSRVFAALSEEERGPSVVVFANGDYESWKSVMQILLTLVVPKPGWSDKWAWHLTYLYGQPDSHNELKLDATTKAYAEVAALVEVIEAYFQPRVEYARWRGVYAKGNAAGVHFAPLRVSPASSAHEKMEALLFLRDFAREIGKHSEAEPLLRELMS